MFDTLLWTRIHGASPCLACIFIQRRILQKMKLKILETLETNDFNDSKRPTKMATLWGRNFTKIKEAFANNKMVGFVYHTYESNYMENCQLSLCIEDEREGEFDTWYGRWKTYDVDFNDPLGISKVWDKIWADEETGILNRAYVFDYEAYNPDGTVMIKISVLK